LPQNRQRILTQQRIAVLRARYWIDDEGSVRSRRTVWVAVSMLAADASIPVLAASTPMSDATDSICAATVSGGNS